MFPTARPQIMQQAAGGAVPDTAVTAVMGMAKVFVGDLVEQGTPRPRPRCAAPRALGVRPTCRWLPRVRTRGGAGLAIMAERGETGPLRPWHIREAYRRLERTTPAGARRRRPPLRQ